MSITNEEIVKAISEKSVMDLVNLVKMIEEKLGVSAAAVAMAAPAAAGGASAPAVEEQTEFTVMMTSHGANKINVIKVIREITGLGLKEAKDMVEGVPSMVKEGISKEDAESIKKKLVEAGAAVDIK